MEFLLGWLFKYLSCSLSCFCLSCACISLGWLLPFFVRPFHLYIQDHPEHIPT